MHYEEENLSTMWRDYGKDWEEWSIPEEELPAPHTDHDWSEAGLLAVDPQIDPARPPLGVNDVAEMLHYVLADNDSAAQDLRLEIVANEKSFGDFAERLWRSYKCHYYRFLEKWLEKLHDDLDVWDKEVKEWVEDSSAIGHNLFDSYRHECKVYGGWQGEEVYSHFCRLWKAGYISDEAFKAFLGYIKDERKDLV